MVLDIERKTCSSCLETKDLESFSRCGHGKYGKSSQCKICRNLLKKLYQSTLGKCPVEGCRNKAQGRNSDSLCAAHDRTRRIYGDPLAPDLRRRKGDECPTWRGEECGYHAAHQRVIQAKGRARDLPCVDCGSTARDWSYCGNYGEVKTELIRSGAGWLEMPYSLDARDYEPRCPKCHRIFDQGR